MNKIVNERSLTLGFRVTSGFYKSYIHFGSYKMCNVDGNNMIYL